MDRILNKFWLVLAILVLPMAACEEDGYLDELPKKIATFVTQHYPGVEVKEYTVTVDTYHVRLAGGPGLTFDKDCNWLAVNGYGEALPQVMLFDNLPPALYEYLQTGSLTSEVLSMERTSRLYTLVLVDTTIYYDIDTGKITQGERPAVD